MVCLFLSVGVDYQFPYVVSASCLINLGLYMPQFRKLFCSPMSFLILLVGVDYQLLFSCFPVASASCFDSLGPVTPQITVVIVWIDVCVIGI